MGDLTQPPRGRRRFGLAVAAVSGISYFAILVVGAIHPSLLARPVANGPFSIGLAAGSLLVIFIVISAAIYTFSRIGEDGR